MSDYLDLVATRAASLIEVVQPRLPALFEPDATAAGQPPIPALQVEAETPAAPLDPVDTTFPWHPDADPADPAPPRLPPPTPDRVSPHPAVARAAEHPGMPPAPQPPTPVAEPPIGVIAGDGTPSREDTQRPSSSQEAGSDPAFEEQPPGPSPPPPVVPRSSNPAAPAPRRREAPLTGSARPAAAVEQASIVDPAVASERDRTRVLEVRRDRQVASQQVDAAAVPRERAGGGGEDVRLPATTPGRDESPAIALPRVDPAPVVDAVAPREHTTPVSPPEPVVHVTIGRIEVRAERPAAAPRQRPRGGGSGGGGSGQNVMSLDEYLRQRSEGASG